ncbi:nucleotidyltransferase domain-containing protein [Kitasatospora sp. DSM 101779]|uniref:nucleotidyltransferase domain-containing protein n=1 Tax=Kitasatospora sp. DSM 101779 TaxID=2853165 RepID=UPI0039858F7A
MPPRASPRERSRGPPVPCRWADQQVYFHQAYEPTDRDRHDMAQPRQAFGIATHV